MTVTVIWVLVAIIAAVAIVLQIVILSALYRALHELTFRVERSAGWLEQMTTLIVITIQILAEKVAGYLAGKDPHTAKAGNKGVLLHHGARRNRADWAGKQYQGVKLRRTLA